MKILMLAPYPPYPPHSGGALRIYNLIRGLAARHTVWCLTFASDQAVVAALAPLREHCHLVTVQGPPRRGLLRRAWTTFASSLPDMALRNRSHTYTATLRRLLATSYFDIVQAASIEMAAYGLLAPPPTRRILDEFNAEYVLQRRAAFTDLRRLFAGPRALAAAPYSLIQWGKLARYERQLLHHYDYTLAVSDEDRRAMLRLAPTARIGIVPNGVDSDLFQPAPAASTGSPPTLIFTGTLDFRPNVDAVLWFARSVLPRIRAYHPDVRFHVVGRTPAAAVRALHDGQHIIVQPDVPDVRPLIAQATVYVIPLRIGGGVRLKLLEALAMQAAVVSTSMGAEGVRDLHSGTHLLLADTAATFAAAVLRLLNNPAERQHMGTAGRTLVRDAYDWRAIVPQLEALYHASGT